jgi:subtilisin family serine protease
MSHRTTIMESRLRGRGLRGLLSLVSALAVLGLSVPAALGAMPNDPSFSLQWGDDNTGQSVPGQESEEILGPAAPGTPGDDDGALKAWRVSTGSRSIVIGEADTGVDYTHPDLAANIWTNPGGIGGCAAGTHGYDVMDDSCDPLDEDKTYGGHGTHVAGIMGAVGNNGIGVAGINWQTTILPVKWLSTANSGSTSALIEALEWLVAVKRAGVNIRVVNDSDTFLDTSPSAQLSHEIGVLGANDILFVTAAGNSGENDDEAPRYPCAYALANEICVTASNDDDELPSWANYGSGTVDLAAPGVSIYSTLREGKYGYLSGGSMAAAQVSGAAALILSVDPSLSASELKADILNHVNTEPALSGKVATGGTLNICAALPGCEPPPPPPTALGGGDNTIPPSGDTTSVTGSTPVTPAPSTTAADAVVVSTTIVTQGSRAGIRLRCQGPKTCRSRVILAVKTRRKDGKNAARTTVRIIGVADFSIPAGKVATVSVKLNPLGNALLRAARGRLDTELTIPGSSSGSPKTQTVGVRLVWRQPQWSRGTKQPGR